MRLPKLFSSKNNTRYYKVKIKGISGTITFSELVKRSFVTDLLIKNLQSSKMDTRLINKIDYDEKRVITEEKQLKFFQPMFKAYVDEVRQNLYKKNISIVNYYLKKIIISPYDEKALKVESEVKIEVSI